MKQVGAGEFKAKCLALLDEVARTGEPIVVTKRGRAVARIVPERALSTSENAMRGSVLGEDDIVSPIQTEWDAERDP